MFDKAPARIQLFGNKTKKLESAQHVIEFPGGAIEVSRTSDGNYWAHIHINRDFANSDCEGLRHCLGTVIGSRLGTQFNPRRRKPIRPIPKQGDLQQIAILIKPDL